MDTKTRYVAKRYRLGRRELFGIYDTQRASWPVMMSHLGKIPQNFPTEDAAQAWADTNLNERI